MKKIWDRSVAWLAANIPPLWDSHKLAVCVIAAGGFVAGAILF